MFLCAAPDQLGDGSCSVAYAHDRATFWWTDTECQAFSDILNAQMPPEYVTPEGERYVVHAACQSVPDSCVNSDCLDRFEGTRLEQFRIPR